MRWLLVFAFLLPATARADAVGPAPACPPGARGEYAHEGEWCVPAPCPCGEGQSCRSWRVCTRAAMVQPGGLGGFDDPPYRAELVVGSCDPARACDGTEEPPPSVVGTFEPGAPTCRDAMFCVPEALPILPPRGGPPPPQQQQGTLTPRSEDPAPSARGSNCGCGTPGPAPAALFAFSILIVPLVRRRR